MLQVKTIR